MVRGFDHLIKIKDGPSPVSANQATTNRYTVSYSGFNKHLLTSFRRVATLVLSLAILWAVEHSAVAQPASAKQPNILVILADDMGYGDLGCMGSKHLKTPHIDGIAARGLRCIQGYVPSSVCSPSRAGIFTGRDPRRFGYEGNLNKAAEGYAGRPELLGLPLSEHTMADHLKAAGYATALIGKWHQGVTPPFHPNQRGFDYFMGMLGGGHDYFPTAEKNQLERNGTPLTEFSSPYLTDFFTDEGLAWLKNHNAGPWFLFMSYNAPHTPMQATEADLALYSHIQNKRRRTYAAMVHALDRGVGRLVEYLRESGQLDNTVIVFFSDNGGATNNGSWNGPLSGAKGALLEGGVRVPFLISWPAKLPHGVSFEHPVSALDLLPTFLAAAQARPLPEKPAPSHEDKRNRRRYANLFGRFDGINMLPVLSGTAEPSVRTLHWRLQGQSAILWGDLKLIRPSHRPAQLFAPGRDISEQQDLAAKQPEKLAELFLKLGQWESHLATVPIWDSSPYWTGASAKIYDTFPPKAEPE